MCTQWQRKQIFRIRFRIVIPMSRWFGVILPLAVIMVASCRSSRHMPPGNGSQVVVVQEGREVGVKGDKAIIKLKKAPFSIQFNNGPYNAQTEEFNAAQLVAVSQRSALMDIHTGQFTDDLELLSPGSGLAADADGSYNALYLDETGHHYLIYGPEDRHRLQLLADHLGGLRLQFNVDRVYDHTITTSIEDLPLDRLYLALLIDRNQNGFIEKGELVKMEIRFHQ